MKTLTIVGKRWFQKTYGNTYHSAEIYVDGEHAGTVTIQYGYGDSYVDSAVDMLAEQGLLKYDRDVDSPFWRWCQENGIHLETTVADVAREKDL